MPPIVLDLKTVADPRDAIYRAVEALADGKLVAIPTETVYGVAASALNPESVMRLIEAKNRDYGKALALGIKGADDALDYVPEMPPLARRLARRLWPGPVTLVLNDAHPDSVIGRLPELVRNAVVPDGRVGLRVPAHSVALQVLRLTAGPIVLTSANQSGQPDPLEAQDVIDQLGDRIDLILDDGRSKLGQSSSVVQIDGYKIKMLRAGVMDEKTLKRMSGFMALIVCTGNTCRSPMAEMIFKKQLAARIGCEISELEDRGFFVQSAGIAAMPGGRPTPEAVEVLTAMGLDLSDHASQPVSERLIKYADIILTMTSGHYHALITQWPEVATRVRMLCKDGMNVSDPIGGTLDLYKQCANQINEKIKHWIDDIDLSPVETE
jgi:tRNA threonylcarbamoyl adenosine modification protein (Sua5/YciO/YrdC/YwlC family)